MVARLSSALLCAAVALLAVSELACANVVEIVVRRDSSGKWHVAPNSDAAVVATVRVNESYDVSGWDIVEGVANDQFLTGEQTKDHVGNAYYAIGYGEGYGTYVRIAQNFKNAFEGDSGLQKLLDDEPKLRKWIDEHIAFLEQYPQTDEFGQQLHNMLRLLHGLADGYAARRTEAEPEISFTQFFYLNFDNEMGDIVKSYSSSARVAALRDSNPRYFYDLHCSALIKLLPSDVYFAHVTWSGMHTTLRQYKTYRVGEKFTTMSSYPGVVHSIDDWYMTHSRLAVMETTHGVYNHSLFKDFISTETVSEFLRVMIANFLAIDSPTWVQHFSRNNSGTYNNQWMVFNMGLYLADGTMPKDTFWVAEQLPGSAAPYGVTSADMSSDLLSQGYWASYNNPHFESVYKISGTYDQFIEMGSFYSHTESARPKIFRRDHVTVTDLDSMMALMRYNDYKNDELSLIPNCKGAGKDDTCDPPYSAMLAIAARGDLNPPGDETNYGPVYRSLGHRNHFATDVKIAVWSEMHSTTKYVAHLINGPTRSHGLPPFNWTEFDFDVPHYGLPEAPSFPAVRLESTGPSSERNERDMWIGIGVGAATSTIVVAAIIFILVKSRQRSKDLTPEEVAFVQ